MCLQNESKAMSELPPRVCENQAITDTFHTYRRNEEARSNVKHLKERKEEGERTEREETNGSMSYHTHRALQHTVSRAWRVARHQGISEDFCAPRNVPLSCFGSFRLLASPQPSPTLSNPLQHIGRGGGGVVVCLVVCCEGTS